MGDEKSIRSFLAIDVPPEVLSDISGIQAGLKKTLQGAIRWVRPGGMHLTLKFFGDVSENDIAVISRIAGEHVNGIGPFALHVQKLGVFPDINRPRVLWLGIYGDVGALVNFQKAMDQKLHGGGFAEEKRPFSPHLTLARIKEPRGLIGLAKIVENRDNYTAGHFNAGGLNLYRSYLTPRGAVYTKLAYFPFEG
ncbi:MAG: RNA 2',3'-cyclic phosphodiesterase [Deltaproteobacteria bacterium]|nr:RNA 2',3'-cyclic phosphodiesterase [Deltaproteobacteria bacterium]